MTLTVKLAGATLAAAVVAAVEIVAVQTLPAPEAFWPVTVTGWFSLAGSVIVVVGGTVGAVRWWRAPVKTAIAESEARQQQAVTAMEKKLTHDIADASREANTQLDRFRESVTAQMNGYGRRLDNVETNNASQEGIVNGLLQSMAESKLDRKHHGEALQRIESGLEKMREQHSREMQELTRALAAMARRRDDS